MVAKLLRKIFGSRNERLVKRMRKQVAQINALESEFEALSDEELQSKTQQFRERLEGGESLDDLLAEAFATVREAGKRVLQMRHYDVQLIGGMVLHQGKIAEMRTGEGKTLVATLAAYLNALPGNGVHVVTVNDYLAQRDADWMGKIYNFLGMSVGVILSNMPFEDKQAAYAADITYGTNNEFGFDYLRDNMAFSKAEQFQRSHAFAIVDEVDSILIDEARLAVLQLKVDVLAGQELQSFVGGQLDLDRHHIVRTFLQLFHPTGQGFHHDILGGADFLGFDRQVGQRLGAAKQRPTLCLFFVLQGIGRMDAVVELAGQDLAFAGTAGAIAASVWERKAFAQRSLENGFVVVDGEMMPAGLDGNLIRHDVSLKYGDKPSDYRSSGQGFYPCRERVTGRLA